MAIIRFLFVVRPLNTSFRKPVDIDESSGSTNIHIPTKEDVSMLTQFFEASNLTPPSWINMDQSDDPMVYVVYDLARIRHLVWFIIQQTDIDPKYSDDVTWHHIMRTDEVEDYDYWRALINTFLHSYDVKNNTTKVDEIMLVYYPDSLVNPDMNTKATKKMRTLYKRVANGYLGKKSRMEKGNYSPILLTHLNVGAIIHQAIQESLPNDESGSPFSISVNDATRKLNLASVNQGTKSSQFRPDYRTQFVAHNLPKKTLGLSQSLYNATFTHLQTVPEQKLKPFLLWMFDRLNVMSPNEQWVKMKRPSNLKRIIDLIRKHNMDDGRRLRTDGLPEEQQHKANRKTKKGKKKKKKKSKRRRIHTEDDDDDDDEVAHGFAGDSDSLDNADSTRTVKRLKIGQDD